MHEHPRLAGALDDLPGDQSVALATTRGAASPAV